MESLAKRLIAARTKKELTQGELAKRVGVTQSSIGNLESGLRKTSRSIAAIAAALGVRALWLETGKGPMEPDLDPATPPSPSLRSVHPGNNESMTAIRKINVHAAASLHNHAYDQTEPEISPLLIDGTVLSKLGVNPKHVMAMDIKGPSMEPTLYSGDTIIIDTTSRTPKAGDIFVVNFNGQVVVKRFAKKFNEWFLTSDNQDKQAHPDEICRNASAVIIGKFLLKQSSRSDFAPANITQPAKQFSEHIQAVIDLMQSADIEGQMRIRLAAKDAAEVHRQRRLNSVFDDIAPADIKNDPDFIKQFEALLRMHAIQKKENTPF